MRKSILVVEDDRTIRKLISGFLDKINKFNVVGEAIDGQDGVGSRVEHYEMAGYTSAISLAKQLGNSDVVSLLSESLKEEQAADEKLRKIGQQILQQAPTDVAVKKLSATN
jgi:ferritin-like metal-binding protein YciE